MHGGSDCVPTDAEHALASRGDVRDRFRDSPGKKSARSMARV